MCHIGMLIYVQPSLLVNQRHGLEKQLENIDGVYLANFAAGRQHLLTVEYDPEKLNSNNVLEQVVDCGINANYFV
jgi:multidrug efflux pump subunit AcrB